jgi:hypothetical protein
MICKNCGTSNMSGAEFCIFCGERLIAEDDYLAGFAEGRRVDHHDIDDIDYINEKKYKYNKAESVKRVPLFTSVLYILSIVATLVFLGISILFFLDSGNQEIYSSSTEGQYLYSYTYIDYPSMYKLIGFVSLGLAIISIVLVVSSYLLNKLEKKELREYDKYRKIASGPFVLFKVYAILTVLLSLLLVLSATRYLVILILVLPLSISICLLIVYIRSVIKLFPYLDNDPNK